MIDTSFVSRINSLLNTADQVAGTPLELSEFPPATPALASSVNSKNGDIFPFKVKKNGSGSPLALANSQFVILIWLFRQDTSGRENELNC
jgi:hypothetical protein